MKRGNVLQGRFKAEFQLPSLLTKWKHNRYRIKLCEHQEEKMSGLVTWQRKSGQQIPASQESHKATIEVEPLPLQQKMV